MSNKYRRGRQNFIVFLLVAALVGFLALTTAKDKYGIDVGLPELPVPSLSFLYDMLDEYLSGSDGTDVKDNALAVFAQADAPLSVTFLDMGQADSILIQAPDKTVLIDAGENGQGPLVLRYLRERGVDKIDILIGTHPHSDHIGGMDEVVEGIGVGMVIMPDIPEDIMPTGRTYTDLLLAISKKGLKLTSARPGEKYELGGGAVLTIIAPLGKYGDLNDMSVVSRLEYGETSFLFTGDIEAKAESDIIASGRSIRSDVLDMPHHGSNTSSTKEFLEAVLPSIATISCGLDNSYGHPHREPVERVGSHASDIFRTYLNGCVTITSDGKTLAVKTEK